MKPILAIPSYKRPHTKILAKLKDIHLDKYLFIRAEEYDDYKAVAEENGFRIVKLKKVTDIGNTREAIVKYCDFKGFEWAFVFDDDIGKVECLARDENKPTRVTAWRILYEPDASPRFEEKAIKKWFKTAKQYNLSLSSPNHRAYDRFHHGMLEINSSACIQCVLLHIPDVMAVGNYKSLRLVGNEDYYLQFKLMKAGYSCGKVGSIEYDCPGVGCGKGGNNADEYSDINERYAVYVQTFLDNVCSDPKLITTKTTSSGQKSIQFIWKNWEKQSILLPEFDVPF